MLTKLIPHSGRLVLAVLMLSSAALALGCDPGDKDDGDAEKFGAKIDALVEDLEGKDKDRNPTDDIKDAANDIEKGVKDAANDIEERIKGDSKE